MLFRLLCRIVVGGTQRLEWPAPKLLRIAVMTLDVVADGRDRDLALQPAHPTQRLDRQLVLAGLLPARQAVPATPGPCLV